MRTFSVWSPLWYLCNFSRQATVSHGSAFTKKTCDVMVNMTEKQGDKDAVLSGGDEKGRKKQLFPPPQKKAEKLL